MSNDTAHIATRTAASHSEVTCVVGIGASAGGIRALEALFEHMSSNTGLTFIVVQHLSPDFKSRMDEILGRATEIPIIKSSHDMMIEPNKIYLITPNNNITIRDGRFAVAQMDREQIQKPIDVLLKSIAQSYGSRSVGVILSGTGTDGAEGMINVSESGGLTIAQAPDTAQFDGMPSNALATNCVDIALAPEDIATLLASHATDPTARTAIEEFPSSEALSGISLVFALVCDRHGIDFTDYKSTTVARRLERRMQATQTGSVEEYAALLQEDQAEVDLLYYDLLIGVTKFFRDAEAFFAMQSHLNRLVGRLGDDEELRVWIAGCATGEEAYSIAMLAVEAFDRHDRHPKMKILATDLHQGALDQASRGDYSPESLEFVNQERQQRFFTPVDKRHYRVKAELRRHMVFARHNVIRNPPFTRMHVVTCRNLLIYLEPKAQSIAISSFHFALEQNGLLMLGSSETPGKIQAEFDVLDDTWRIYRKLRTLPRMIGSQKPAELQSVLPRRLVNILDRDRPQELSFTALLESYDLLLEEYVQCGLLLDSNRRVLHAFGHADRYLSSDGGRFTGNVLRLLQGDARTSIGAALVRSVKQPNARFVLRGVCFDLGDDEETRADVTVRSLQNSTTDRRVWFVEFQEADLVPKRVEEEVTISNEGDDYLALESELAYTKESLSATIEELETSNEELQATNEQLIASNEELQSTNQELQSVNEELYSVNTENQRKITELHEVTEDIENLMRSTDIGTIFVDGELRIRKFTLAATEYFSLVSHDVGRPLTDFSHNLSIDNLASLVRSVIDSGVQVVREAVHLDSHRVLVKVVPYESGSQRIGAIINLVDVPGAEEHATNQ